MGPVIAAVQEDGERVLYPLFKATRNIIPVSQLSAEKQLWYGHCKILQLTIVRDLM